MKLIRNLAFLLILGFSWTACGGIGVSTLGIDISVAPGQSFRGSFSVVNGGQQPAEVQIILSDFERTLDGGVRIYPPGSLDRSLAPYLTFIPTQFTLDAGKAREVHFTVSIPEGAAGPHWAILLVEEVVPEEQAEEDEEEREAEGRLRIRFGVQIRQLDPTHAINEGRITDMEVLLPEGEQPLTVIAIYENTGTTFQRPKGELRIIDSLGEVVRRAEIEPFHMLPGGKRRLTLKVEEPLTPGDYLALVVLDFGGEYLLGGQARFTLP